jgi:trimeric autotransporter adhesin
MGDLLHQRTYPEGVKVDDVENIYIADTGNHQIRKVSSATGIIITVAGWNPGFGGDGGPSVSASVRAPRNVALDSSRNLYIADTGNHAIRKIEARTGIITTVAGRGGSFGYSGDEGRGCLLEYS